MGQAAGLPPTATRTEVSEPVWQRRQCWGGRSGNVRLDCSSEKVDAEGSDVLGCGQFSFSLIVRCAFVCVAVLVVLLSSVFIAIVSLLAL